MDEAMSGLDYFNFVMSDKCKRIKTLNCAKELRLQTVQWNTAVTNSV